MEAIVANRAGNKAVPIEAAPESRRCAGLYGFGDDVLEVGIARADRHAAFYLKAKPVALAGNVAVHDNVVHRLALPVLLDRHAHDETGLRERGFLPEQRSKEIGGDDILVGETFAAGQLRGPRALFVFLHANTSLALNRPDARRQLGERTKISPIFVMSTASGLTPNVATSTSSLRGIVNVGGGQCAASSGLMGGCITIDPRRLADSDSPAVFGALFGRRFDARDLAGAITIRRRRAVGRVPLR